MKQHITLIIFHSPADIWIASSYTYIQIRYVQRTYTNKVSVMVLYVNVRGATGYWTCIVRWIYGEFVRFTRSILSQLFGSEQNISRTKKCSIEFQVWTANCRSSGLQKYLLLFAVSEVHCTVEWVIFLSIVKYRGRWKEDLPTATYPMFCR